MKTDRHSILIKRARLLKYIREFFWKRGYHEIDTPLLSPALIPEAVIDVVAAACRTHTGKAFPLWLIPSPEVWMKRLLASGSGNIFQITKAFRNCEPPTGLHSLEFTMLEWYTRNADYLDSMRLQEELIERARKKLKTGTEVTIRGINVKLAPPFRRMTMREAFFEMKKIDLDGLASLEALAACAERFEIERSPLDDWESLFHKLYLQEIEPLLPTDRPLFLLDYPARIPTLARLKTDGYSVERWELFIAGIEIANCYTEERDRERIQRFFREQDAKKQPGSQRTDWDLAGIISSGLPPCSGNAMGVDRLLMVLCERDTIDRVQTFPLESEK